MDRSLLASLPVPQRLALAYAPALAQPAWLALLAFDTRLAQLLRSSREPLLVQMRLAWWRERLREPTSQWPLGEPLLAALGSWDNGHGALEGLVDGWEELIGDAPLATPALERFGEGRASAMQALAEVLKQGDAAAEALRAGRGWAITDLAAHIAHPEERAAARELAFRYDWQKCRLPSVMRPLAVLHALSRRAALRKEPGTSGDIGDLLVAMRVGMLGF